MFSKIRNYINEVNVEMRKVSWATPQELLSSTIIVLVSVLFLTVFIGICDVIISWAISLLIR